MTVRPAYFDPIRERAAKRWDQLESDPELAGPWYQLFKQVQSPRHILSELLQNADDAGATEATVRIEDHSFIFTHNGDDFAEEHFASLCRFGYSNKRALHTIGFRGIGFKSTFSLGDTVCLRTPTLSVAFERRRFTEPKWINGRSGHEGLTEIRIDISDIHRQREVEKNLEDWISSPISLLFFKHIRRLRIGDQEMHWGSMGPGPVPDTEWMALYDDPDNTMLIIRSAAEPFPEEALLEIKQERLLGDDQDTSFPPCKVEIVLGAKGRLYVVLPTGVETALPFACNAPFIQDPARLKIKDPETSPTNRWLLERVGSLAACVMLQLLEQTSTSLLERSRAYGLFPDVDRDDNTLESACATTVEEAFDEALGESSFLLTSSEQLKPAKEAVIIPDVLSDVWGEDQVSSFFDSAGRASLSRHISRADRSKLLHREVVEDISKETILTVLQSKHLPKPESWGSLLKLWEYIAPNLTSWQMTSTRSKLMIVPVQGKNVLYAADEVVRLGEKRLLQTEADWEFLSRYLLVLNQNWPRFLADQRRQSEGAQGLLNEEVETAYTVLKSIGLEEAGDANKIVERVSRDFFSRASNALSDCVRLAQIAAKLGATVADCFRFATRDKKLKARNQAVLFDRDGTLEELLPEGWRSRNLLHPDYTQSFTSCTPEDWQRWISSGRSGIQEFVPLTRKRLNFWGRGQIEAEIRRRGCSAEVTYPFVTSQFIVEDWDFEQEIWGQWSTCSKHNENIWGNVIERLFLQPDTLFKSTKDANAFQVSTTGSTRSITFNALTPSWVLKFRDLPCLRDTRGFYHKPSDLLRRTPATESLMDVEPFVHGLLDTEANRPLLILLGVRDKPTGPHRLLDCLRALAQTNMPPIYEVEKWYRRLDQLMNGCSTDDHATILQVFRKEKIILTDACDWVSAASVFLSSNDEDVPGAAVIRASVRDLALWRRIGIAEQPTADLAVRWLKELPSGEVLSQDDARRVRAIIARHASRIWEECGHWLNLAREWAPIATLEYALTMQSLVEYSHLHEWVKQKTADLQRLPNDIAEAPPFSNLPRLSTRIEERFDGKLLFSGASDGPPWLTCFGSELCRIELNSEGDTARIRALAADLAETAWQTTPSLETVPYIDGIPAGTPRRADVVWSDRVLYVAQLPKAKLARVVPDRLAKFFGQQDVAAALNYCFGRSTEDVTEYLEENFKLSPPDPQTSSSRGAEHTNLQNVPGGNPSAPVDSVIPNVLEAIATRDEDPEEIVMNAQAEADVEGKSEEATPDGELLNEVTPSKHPHPPKPAKPSIIERFARSQGFEKDSEDRFFHPDGSWIGKANGDRFPWERRTAAGDVIRHYWPREHCLDQAPLQLEADIWGLIEKFPDDYALVLSDPQGNPVEVLGSRLRAMRDNEELKLYPATYRLVLDYRLDHRPAGTFVQETKTQENESA